MSDVFHSTQICMETKWNVVRDEVGGYIYAYDDNKWLSYDDIETVIIKVSLYSHTSHTLSPALHFVPKATGEVLNIQVNQEFEKILQHN